MKVHLRQIPPDGLHLEGEEDCLIPDLESEGVRCVAPMQYNIDIVRRALRRNMLETKFLLATRKIDN